MPKLKINDIEVDVEPGTSILQAAETIGVEIPRFCYHDKLSVPANCRMCLVELEGAPKPVASCAMAAGEGMVIKTESALTQKARRGVMEMLLINHPLDCPICDQGGECDLQDQAVGYGFDRSRYHENKRAVKDKNIGPLIKTIMTRCINCTRCVRFGEEIAGVTELGQLNRGENAEIGTFIEAAVTTELSGNMIDICPVGALTSKPYAFTARPWELKKTETIDVHDAVGSNIRVDSRGREVMRILPRMNEDVNEEWINDRTRFAYDGLKKNRLDRPYVRKNGKLEEVSWEEALGVVAQRMQSTSPDKMAAFAGDLCDVESMVALKDLMTAFGATNLECRVDGGNFEVSSRAAYLFNSTIAGIEEADAILLIGTNPRLEATLINARIRKSWLERQTPVGLVGEGVDLTYPYTHLGEAPADLKNLSKSKDLFVQKFAKAQRPAVIVGAGAFARPDGPEIQGLVYNLAQNFNIVKDGWNGFNFLHNAASRVGALEIGFLPKNAYAYGEMEFVYLLNTDTEFVLNSINPDAFKVYQGHHGDRAAAMADVVLPGAAYTEKDGLYVNTEGRVQRARKAVEPPGQAKEDWRIIRALSEFCGKTLRYDDLYQLRERLSEGFPRLALADSPDIADWDEFGMIGDVSDAPFRSPVTNFYNTNVITNASTTMRECEKAFLQPEQKMLEAAE